MMPTHPPHDAEHIGDIIDRLAGDSQYGSLKACSTRSPKMNILMQTLVKTMVSWTATKPLPPHPVLQKMLVAVQTARSKMQQICIQRLQRQSAVPLIISAIEGVLVTFKDGADEKFEEAMNIVKASEFMSV